jgi:hypothetical protein
MTYGCAPYVFQSAKERAMIAETQATGVTDKTECGDDLDLGFLTNVVGQGPRSMRLDRSPV